MNVFILLEFGDDFFDNFGEVGHFELVLFLGDVVDSVIGGEGDTELGDDLASIADGGDPVDCHACLCLASSLHGFVDVMAPHALAAILRQEGWVDIDDAMGVGVDEEVGHQGQEACQHDEADVVLLQKGHHDVGIVEVGLGGNGCRYAEALCTHEGVGVGLITDNESAMYALGVGKVSDQVLAVRPAA